jgi:ubiquinone biosynthesis protein Coq4
MNKMYSILIRWRSGLLVFLTHNMALPVLRFVRKPKRFPYSAAELYQLPKGTLGNDLMHFLEQKKLQLMPHYAKHDMKHILLNYDTTDEGEVCLQSFMLGNRHLSFPVAATVLYGFITMPEHWSKFIAAYKRGKKSIRLANWNWFELLQEPTIVLILKINHRSNDTV